MTKCVLGVALLVATLSLSSQTQQDTRIQKLLQFTLNESPQQIITLLGRPSRIDDSVAGYQSWQYEFSSDEQLDDNSPPAWFVCLSTSRHEILSVTRNFDKPQNVDSLLPDSRTAVHYWPSKEAAQFSVRLRQLPGEVLLLAMGTAKPGERTTQIILIRRSALKTFMPWLAEQLR